MVRLYEEYLTELIGKFGIDLGEEYVGNMVCSPIVIKSNREVLLGTSECAMRFAPRRSKGTQGEPRPSQSPNIALTAQGQTPA